MHAVSTNQIADLLHFNDNGKYETYFRHLNIKETCRSWLK